MIQKQSRMVALFVTIMMLFTMIPGAAWAAPGSSVPDKPSMYEIAEALGGELDEEGNLVKNGEVIQILQVNGEFSIGTPIHQADGSWTCTITVVNHGWIPEIDAELEYQGNSEFITRNITLIYENGKWVIEGNFELNCKPQKDECTVYYHVMNVDYGIPSALQPEIVRERFAPETYATGSTVHFQYPSELEVKDEVNEGTWKFYGWYNDCMEKAGTTLENIQSDVHLKGVWHFVKDCCLEDKEYNVLYHVDYAFGVPKDNRPAAVEETFKDDNTYARGSDVSLLYPSELEVVDEINHGIWKFHGWYHGLKHLGTTLENIQFHTLLVGYWTFTESETPVEPHEMFTVSYDLNGGEGFIQSKKYSPGHLVVIKSIIPTKANASFEGWLAECETVDSWTENGRIFYKNDMFNMPAGHVTLTAQWKEDGGSVDPETEMFTVSYDLNGGEGSIESKDYASGTTVAVTDVVPVKEGFELEGWEYDGELYQANDTFVMPEKDVVLVAQWKDNGGGSVDPETEMFTVSYDLNGGEGSIESKDYASGTTVAVTDVVPVKEGFELEGWEYDGELYQANDTFVMPEKDVTLVAQWKSNGGGNVDPEPEDELFEVKYDLNGGKSDVTIEAKEYKAGSTVVVTEVVPVKEGFDFEGWKYDGNIYDADDTFVMPEKDVTLAAQWKSNGGGNVDPEPEDELFEVKYDLNGGKSDVTIEAKEYKAGEIVTVTNVVPTKEGSVFGGWNYGKDNYKATNTFKMPAQDVTLTAVWSSNGGGGGGSNVTTHYTLTYESNGGTEYAPEEYKSGEVVKLDKVPEREGYGFMGWYKEDNFKNRVTEVTMNRNWTVYAKWDKDHGHGGDGGDGYIAPVPEALNGGDHFAYIVGYEDGTIRPMNNLTRAEVAAIFFRLLKDDVRNSNLSELNAFVDVQAGQWFNTAISTIAELDIVKGRTPNIFAPNASITRAEFAAICSRFDDTIDEGTSEFEDIKGHWAEKEIERAVSLGWIGGYVNKDVNVFRPDDLITRAEAMSMINRVLHRLPETTDDLLDDMKTWIDNGNENAGYYLDVQEATNSHNYEFKEDGLHETWLDLNQNPNWHQYK